MIPAQTISIMNGFLRWRDMAKIDFKGIDDYSKLIAALGNESEEIIKSAVYKGAALVADEIKQGLKSLPIEEGTNNLPPVGDAQHKLTGVSRKQKADLIDSFGLAPIENDGGYIQSKAGVDGYGSIPTKKYPKGVPNVMLMRSIESGTSFRQKNPIFRKATNRARKRAEQAMGNEIDEQLKQRFK